MTDDSPAGWRPTVRGATGVDPAAADAAQGARPAGQRLLAVAADFRPHLLVLDVMLPDIDGFELCRQIRCDRDQVGVVFLTARDRTEDAIAGLTVGGDDYI